jgi:hypothetical protein
MREPYEFEKITELNLELRPIFAKDVDKKYLIDFELLLNLKSTLQGVLVPEHCVLTNGSRNFKIRVDPSQFTPGKPFYGEIQGFDSQHSERGALLRVPLTLIKPLYSPTPSFKTLFTS